MKPASAVAMPSFSGRRGDRSGAVAMEFAIAATCFFMLTLGTMEVGYDLFVQAVLDEAVETAARSVQVGAATGTAGETSSTFVANSVCPNLSGLLNCNLLVVGVAPVTAGNNSTATANYVTNANPITLANASSTGGDICTGTGAQLMLLQAWYIGPTFVGGFVPGFSTTNAPGHIGQQVHLTTASAGFVNEFFGGGQAAGSGGACPSS